MFYVLIWTQFSSTVQKKKKSHRGKEIVFYSKSLTVGVIHGFVKQATDLEKKNHLFCRPDLSSPFKTQTSWAKP